MQVSGRDGSECGEISTKVGEEEVVQDAETGGTVSILDSSCREGEG